METEFDEDKHLEEALLLNKHQQVYLPLYYKIEIINNIIIIIINLGLRRTDERNNIA